MSTLRFIFFTCVLVAYNFLSIAQPQSVVPVGSPKKLTITDNNSLQDKSGKLFLDSKEGKNIFDKYIIKSNNKTKKLNTRIEKTNRKYLKKYFKKAKKLHKKLCRVNPDLADYLFSYSNDPLYHNQNDVENSNYLKTRGASKNYYPEYDSLKTSIAFLKNNKEVNETDSLKFESAWEMTEQLDSNLTNSSRLQQYFRERKSTFKASLKNYPELESYFKEIDKINYYYHEQISEYKNVLGDLSNVEEKALEILKGNSAFKKLLYEQGQLSVFAKAPPDWGKSIDGQRNYTTMELFVPVQTDQRIIYKPLIIDITSEDGLPVLITQLSLSMAVLKTRMLMMPLVKKYFIMMLAVFRQD